MGVIVEQPVQIAAGKKGFFEISQIQDEREKALEYLEYGTDAMNRGDFTLAIDAYIEAKNCSPVESDTELTARRKIAKLFGVLSKPERGLEYAWEVEFYYRDHKEVTVARQKERIYNLCLLVSLYADMQDDSQVNTLMDILDELEPEDRMGMHVLTAKIKACGLTKEYEKGEKYIAEYIRRIPEVVKDSSRIQMLNEMCFYLFLSYQVEAGKQMLDILEEPIMDSGVLGYQNIYLRNKILYDTLTGADEQYKADVLLFHEKMNLMMRSNIDQVAQNVEFRLHADEMHKAKDRVNEENLKLQEKSLTDALTGLPNRRALAAKMEDAIHNAIENKTSVGFEILDIDYFKQVNDRYGHEGGDTALKVLSDCLKQITSDKVYAARYGGDEFCVIYQDMESSAIRNTAELLKQKLADKKIPNEDSRVSRYLSISQGIHVMRPEDDNHVWEGMSAADHVLYEVKRHRRGEIGMTEGLQ